MQNIASTILALCLTGIFIFMAPLVQLTGSADNVTQENVQLIVDEFVTEVANTGKFTRSKYQGFENELNATGNTYDIDIEILHLDENPGKKTAQTNYTKIGENVYYAEYETQILPQVGIKVGNETPSTEDTMLLVKGSMIKVAVKNTNPTANQTLKSSFLGFSNSGEYAIEASSSAMITVDGVKN